MKKITIEITDDMLYRLKAYTKAEQFETAMHNKKHNTNYKSYKSHTDLATHLIQLELENLPDYSDDVRGVYDKELARLRANKK